MKKFAAIFYLSLLLFTSAGYRMLVQYLEHRAQENLQAVIEEKTYDPAHLIELTAELSLPYLNDWQTWESVEGVVTIGGIPYQYVERLLKGGKMHYRCLPNSRMEQVQSARDRFMQLSYDFTHPAGQKEQPLATVSIKPPVFDLICFEPFALQPGCLQKTTAGYQPFNSRLPLQMMLSVPTPPPDFT